MNYLNVDLNPTRTTRSNQNHTFPYFQYIDTQIQHKYIAHWKDGIPGIHNRFAKYDLIKYVRHYIALYNWTELKLLQYYINKTIHRNYEHFIHYVEYIQLLKQVLNNCTHELAPSANLIQNIQINGIQPSTIQKLKHKQEYGDIHINQNTFILPIVNFGTRSEVVQRKFIQCIYQQKQGKYIYISF
jgi:hypothetical protein